MGARQGGMTDCEGNSTGKLRAKRTALARGLEKRGLVLQLVPPIATVLDLDPAALSWRMGRCCRLLDPPRHST